MQEATAAGLVVIAVGGPDGKQPAVGKRWQQRGLATSEEMERWSRRRGCRNYGILTGQLVDVIDVDAGGDEARARQLVACVAEVLHLPQGWQTRTVATGRGLHLYVRHVPGARSADSIGGVPVEYRAAGRMVVGPGSIHQETGKVYSVVDPAVPIASLPHPDLLIAALPSDASSDSESVDDAIGLSTKRRPSGRRLKPSTGVTAHQALARAEAVIAEAPKGRRNTTLNRRVYALGPWLRSGELAVAEVRRVCGAAARRDRPDGTPGLGDPRELAATLTSAIEAGIRDAEPPDDPPVATLAVGDRICEHPPQLGSPSPGKRLPFRPLTPWREDALLPALALVWRTASATAWDWQGARLDRFVYSILLELAQARCTSIEVEAPLRYLSARTGVHTHYIRASLRRLVDHDWLHLVRQGGPTGKHSPRAPSTYGLRVPSCLAAAPPMYGEAMVRRLDDVFPKLPRAHQLQELPLEGSGLVLPARKSLYAEVVVPSQEGLWGVWDGDWRCQVVEGSPVPVSARNRSSGTRVRRATRRVGGAQRFSAPAHRRPGRGWSFARGELEPELVQVLELLEAAGFAPEVVARRGGRPVASRRVQRRAGLPRDG